MSEKENTKESPKAASTKIMKVTAETDLRVIHPENLAVFVLLAGVAMELPERLAMAAQVAGGEQGIIVNVSK